MARPKRSDPHLRIAHSIEEQLMTRQFTAKQLRACRLILRLSWGCGKETAYIPHPSHFEVVGLYRQDAHATLSLLVAENVIYHDKLSGHFAFNKDFDQWKVGLYQVAVLRGDLLGELIKANLSQSCPLVSDSLTQQLVNHLPPSKYITYQPSFKTEAGKEKERKVKKDTTAATAPTEQSKNLAAVVELYEKNIGMVGPLIRDDLIRISTDYRLDWIREAFKEAVSMNKRALKYIEAILDRWGREGFKAPIRKNTGMPPGRPPKSQLPTGEELEQGWSGG